MKNSLVASGQFMENNIAGEWSKGNWVAGVECA